MKPSKRTQTTPSSTLIEAMCISTRETMTWLTRTMTGLSRLHPTTQNSGTRRDWHMKGRHLRIQRITNRQASHLAKISSSIGSKMRRSCRMKRSTCTNKLSLCLRTSYRLAFTWASCIIELTSFTKHSNASAMCYSNCQKTKQSSLREDWSTRTWAITNLQSMTSMLPSK
jgi:hypothetical protein